MDVFGAGAVLYFALSNTLPFPGKTLKKALHSYSHTFEKSWQVLELTARLELMNQDCEVAQVAKCATTPPSLASMVAAPGPVEKHPRASRAKALCSC